MTGIDVHPVAVHLARAAWTMAARSVMNAAGATGFDSPMSIPVYLGDSLQLRFRTGDMFAEREIRIQTHDENNTELVFPVSLVLQRQFREGCGVMPAWRRGAWHGSVWPVRYCPAYPQATAATRLARTVPGAAFPAPPGRPAAS